MNTIELMLKPLRTALEAVEALGLADDEYTVGLRAAIAAGEAELRREPDATMLSTHQSTWFVQGDEQSEWPDEVQVTKLYTRGETK